jgi:ATP-dependent DNA helicase PIF1
MVRWKSKYISIGGFPLHKLILKLGSPIILLRNIQLSDGLCNGTRLVCRTFQKHVIEAEINTGIILETRVLFLTL